MTPELPTPEQKAAVNRFHFMKKPQTSQTAAIPSGASYICNAVIQSIAIGFEPDGTPIVRVIVENAKEFPLSIAWYCRCFAIPCVQLARSPAEVIGCKIAALAWCLDARFNLFDFVGKVVRVKYANESILGIGHAIYERWLERETKMDLVYPFFTGAPSATLDRQPS